MPAATAGKQKDYDYLFKLVLIGDSGVGKSCLLLRFAVSKQKNKRWIYIDSCVQKDAIFVCGTNTQLLNESPSDLY